MKFSSVTKLTDIINFVQPLQSFGRLHKLGGDYHLNFHKRILLFFIAFLIVISNYSSCFAEYKILNTDIYNTFNYDELVRLSKTKFPNEALGQKLKYVLNTPMINNTISVDNYTFKESSSIGKFIRVGAWNIERGLNLDNIEMIFTDPDKLIAKGKDLKENEIKVIKNQMEIFKNSDIIVLNEVDVGMPRTKYKNVVEEMAEMFNYNYAYGLEFLEVDPAHLGLPGQYKWSEEKFLFPGKVYVVDKNKYKGFHGTAILSKFPLDNVRILRFPETYDWFNSEKNKISDLETVKRVAANKIFKEDVLREIRQGSRMALIADVKIPGTDEILTIAGVHLENRTVPAKRRKEMKLLLKELASVKNPVVIAGDMNTMMYDGSPTSVKKELWKKVTNPHFLIRQALLLGNPYSLVINSFIITTNFTRKYSDPTVKHIPIISPNAERGLFKAVENAKFDDGYTFDFRGDRENSIAVKVGNLGNSNQRALKGFTATYIFERAMVIGKFKLDWIFVKAYNKKPRDKNDPYLMAPHFGRTLFELNYGLKDLLSDHAPITVDLPVQEPVRTKKKGFFVRRKGKK